LLRRDVPILNLLFHSSEAIVGGSPYNRTEGERDAFFDRLSRVLRHARERGAEPMTFEAFHCRMVSAPYPRSARALA
jgi:hypothetical protein